MCCMVSYLLFCQPKHICRLKAAMLWLSFHPCSGPKPDKHLASKWIIQLMYVTPYEDTTRKQHKLGGILPPVRITTCFKNYVQRMIAQPSAMLWIRLKPESWPYFEKLVGEAGLGLNTQTGDLSFSLCWKGTAEVLVTGMSQCKAFSPAGHKRGKNDSAKLHRSIPGQTIKIKLPSPLHTSSQSWPSTYGAFCFASCLTGSPCSSPNNVPLLSIRLF